MWGQGGADWGSSAGPSAGGSDWDASAMWASMASMMGGGGDWGGGWGAAQSWSGKGGGGPYGKALPKLGPGLKKPATQVEDYKLKAPKDMPDVVWLSIPPTSAAVQTGYPDRLPAIEYEKGLDIFAESHHILQDFFDDDIKEAVEFTHDAEGTTFPEVYKAWKASGKEDNTPTVAASSRHGKWAVGLGGTKNAMRAVKLSLALAIAPVADKAKLASVIQYYPAFKQLLDESGQQM